jgi:hypothetical protein
VADPSRFPDDPKHPERICWGCDRLCPADAMACANGTVRAQHPAELFGPDWREWFDRPRRADAERV